MKEGFCSDESRDEELPNEGLFVSFLVSIENVTDRVLEELGNVSQSERNNKLRMIFNSIVSDSTEGTDYSGRVKSFFGGNEFYLMKYITYNDVRLVGAPPSSIGKYGGDTDNWMWPRHTGDFTCSEYILRQMDLRQNIQKKIFHILQTSFTNST